MGETIRLLIADDYAIVREGLRALIATEPGLELVAEASDGIDAVSKVHALKPDVILLDMIMPRKDGLGDIEDIMKDQPDARILVLTSFAEDDKVFPAIKAGCMGSNYVESNKVDGICSNTRLVAFESAGTYEADERRCVDPIF